MKLYRILKSFPGNQTGNGPTEHFVAGTEAKLSDQLAEVVLKAGWVELAETPAAPPRSPVKGVPGLEVVTVVAAEVGKAVAEQVSAEARETKVTGPEETKPLDLDGMNFTQLKAEAKKRGIKLGIGMSEAKLRDLLKA